MTDVRHISLTSVIRHPSAAFLRPFNSWDAAKLIALLLMFVDHSGVFFFPDQQWIRGLGRGAAPIFLFLAGYAANYRFQWDLLILALLISVSDLLLAGQLRTQNILFTILFLRLLFYTLLEKRGHIIERPYEWYVVSIVFLFTIVIVQYGTLGLLFAMCGYMQRRREHYTRAQRQRFMILTFITYCGVTVMLSQFSLLTTLCMIVSVSFVYALLWRLEIREIQCPRCPAWLMKLLKLTSYYTGYIYAFHLIALEWFTGVPF